jgi:pimeloyl-ACP methyl ester carboxylesterase
VGGAAIRHPAVASQPGTVQPLAILGLRPHPTQEPNVSEAIDDYLIARASIPHVKQTMRQLIDGAGHLSHVEQPDAFVAALAESTKGT